MKVISIEDELKTRLVILRGDICRNYMLNKTCDKLLCKYIHDPSICFHHWKFKNCKYGDDCKKKHVNYTSKYDKNKVKKNIKSMIDIKTNDIDDTYFKTENISSVIDKKDSKNELSDDRMGQFYEWPNQKKMENGKGNKRRIKNTECFNPMERPVDVRILIDTGVYNSKLTKTLSDRDILLVPNLFIDYQPGEIYQNLLKEMNACGIPKDKLFKMWHGDSHYIADDKVKLPNSKHSWKENVPTFNMVINRITDFFNMDIKATRYNYYKDGSQWKPFHKDAAAIKEDKAAKQNFTVGVSFGMTRQAAFERDSHDKTVISIPIEDSHIYAFCNKTNILWRHGILQESKECSIDNINGRISIIAWGWCNNIMTLD